MTALSPRLRQVTEGIRDGKSYSEIGASLGISKQAAHKLAHAAITTLRENLESTGFSGLDTLGLLKSGYVAESGCGVSPQTVLGASRHQFSTLRLTISRLVRIQETWEPLPHPFFHFPKHPLPMNANPS